MCTGNLSHDLQQPIITMPKFVYDIGYGEVVRLDKSLDSVSRDAINRIQFQDFERLSFTNLLNFKVDKDRRASVTRFAKILTVGGNFLGFI